jgi:hypothetical protein
MNGQILATNLKKNGKFRIVLEGLTANIYKLCHPKEVVSFFWNYKSFNSWVKLGIANGNCNFIYCYVGGISDEGVIENTKLYEKLVDDSICNYLTKENAKQHNGSSVCFCG